ncbi:putative glycosidase CRH1 [Cyberlindnera fabianii]|uniref:Crh-like protein n=1 Tax=Cyberlindnera fabianii TaxID=36022 RepID=A0A1V2L951_CYBFA|nr:putative glycosidase CRH1 [Cyberlindnera fabianii]
MMFPGAEAFLFAGLLLSGAHAQTSDCNPLKSSKCPSDPALGATFAEDFKTNSTHFTPYAHPERISYSDDGVEITLAQRYDNPSLKSNFYIMFGRLEVQLKAAPGRGVVSSFYLQSDDLDEIDLEWIGSDTTEVQSNYFSKGNTTTYTRGEFHGVDRPQEVFHNYTIDWTKDSLTFYLDGDILRTINSDDPQGYPQSPMFVVTGVWAGGDPDNAAGTIQWAGGETDYSAAPYSMYIKSMIVSDYSTGSEYVYSDTSGDWSSITAVDGEINGRYDEGVEQFSMLSLGSEASSFQSSSSSYDALSSSYARHSTHISSSAISSSSLQARTTSSDSKSTLTLTKSSSASSSSFTSIVEDDPKNSTTSESEKSSTLDTGALDSSSSASALRTSKVMGLPAVGLNAIAVTLFLSFLGLIAL